MIPREVGVELENTMAKNQKDKRKNNDLQSIAYKTKDRVTQTPLKTGGELRCSGIVSSFCSTSGTHRVTLDTHPVMNGERTEHCLRQVAHTVIIYDTYTT